MKPVLIALLCLTVYSASIKQSWMNGVDFLQPVELSVQLFGQIWNSATQGLETQLLQQLYPGQASTIQAQLDACEGGQIANETAQLQAINADLLALNNACSLSDPTAPFNQLFQDTIQSLAIVGAPCPGLSVNLMGDLENLIAASIVQGAQFANAWTGPLAQFSATSFNSFAGLASGFGPYIGTFTNLSDSTLEALGVSTATVQQTDTDTTTLAATFAPLLNDIATSGVPNATDLVAAINAGLALTNDYGAEFIQIIQASNQFVEQSLQAICAFVGPLTQLGQPAATSS